MVIKGKFIGGLTDIEYTPGQVWMLIFWATWAEQSFAPLTRLNDMAFLNEDFWKDLVSIKALNLDESKKGAQKFLTEKDWLNIEHYHVAKKECTGVNNYGGDGVPHLILIDKTG